MSTIHLKLDQDQTAFEPGQVITGTVRWESDQQPEHVAVRLGWHTEGKGSTDTGLGAEVGLDASGFNGEQAFELTAPAEPFSCSGKVLSICWVVEAQLLPDGTVTEIPIVIAPDRREIDLYETA